MSLELLAAHGLPDTAVLGDFLQRQRWFGGRGRALSGVSVLDVGVLREGEPELLFVVLGALHDDGATERYQVPLAVRRTSTPPADLGDKLLVQYEQDGELVSVYDALAEPALAWWFWRAIAESRRVPTQEGELRYRSEGLVLAPDEVGLIRSLGREQSNTSLVRDDSDVLKIVRRIEPGITPELEMTRALACAGFASIAAPLGSGEYAGAGAGEPAVVAILQPFLHNGTEGWTLALTSLRDLYADAEEAGERDDDARRRAVQEQGASFQPEAARLGDVTAEMHLALTDPSLSEEMRATPLNATALNAWADEMTGELDALLRTQASEVAPLRARRPALVSRFDALRRLDGDAGLSIRIHGDYHLGQVLRVDAGWVVLDFEGEPDRPLAARRVRSSPLRDVAGMMRSFQYAAAAALTERCSPDSREWEQLILQGEVWAKASCDAFWEAYVARAGNAALLSSAEATQVLRQAFEVQKAVYEVGYELGHRPDWVSIPLRYLLEETSR